MKKFILFLLLSVISGQAATVSGDKLNFSTGYDLKNYKGSTYLSIMQRVIKPSLDKYAERGFKITDPSVVEDLLSEKTTPTKNSTLSDKVMKHALADAGTKEQLVSIARELNESDATVTLYNLPLAIRKVARGKVDIYGLSTFLSLLSGGGVAVKVAEGNYFYNVNYGTGKVAKDVQSGRSFGLGPIRGANDASDAAYLGDLQEYIKTEKNPYSLYNTILEMILNCDPAGYRYLSKLGQSIATDFLAVYTAEQDRKLMDFIKKRDWERSLSWDGALLEVTLLSAFHSGQKEIRIMFNGVFTNKTLKQGPGGSARSLFQVASLVDWWQFTSNPDPVNRNRSGINITRKDFTKLEEIISDYEREKNPAMVKRLELILGGATSNETNIFRRLTDYIINLRTPKNLGGRAYLISKEFSTFLMQVRKDANAISAKILKDQGDLRVTPIEAKVFTGRTAVN